MMSADHVSGSASDDEDEVVQRLPVFLSQELAHNLYLLQYPLRAKDRPYTDVGTLLSDTVTTSLFHLLFVFRPMSPLKAKPVVTPSHTSSFCLGSSMLPHHFVLVLLYPGELTAARVKPRQRRVELDYEFDAEAAHIDPDADYDMPKLTLASQTVPPKSNYAVALVRGGRVVLTPLHAICRMTPSFEHVEKALDEERADAERKKVRMTTNRNKARSNIITHYYWDSCMRYYMMPNFSPFAFSHCCELDLVSRTPASHTTSHSSQSIFDRIMLLFLLLSLFRTRAPRPAAKMRPPSWHPCWLSSAASRASAASAASHAA